MKVTFADVATIASMGWRAGHRRRKAAMIRDINLALQGRRGDALRAASLLLIASMTLGGCQPLAGTYRTDSVTIGDEAELNELIGYPFHAEPGPVLRVGVSSETDIARNTEGLYMWGDFCPSGNRRELWVSGPYPDGKPKTGGVDGITPQIPRRDAHGRYHYVVYVDLRGGYDLRTDQRDLCLWATSKGYFPRPTAPFVIPRSSIVPLLPEIRRRMEALELRPPTPKRSV